jgi:hypothetical protein
MSQPNTEDKMADDRSQTLADDNAAASGRGFRILRTSFFPLSIFAAYAFMSGPPTGTRWIHAFTLGAVLAALRLAVLLRRWAPINRPVLAGDLYLITGALVMWTQLSWALPVYRELGASAVCAAIFLVGVASTFWTEAGFVGVLGAPQDEARSFSYILLALSGATTAVAFSLRKGQRWEQVLLVVLIVVAQRVLAARLLRRMRPAGQGQPNDVASDGQGRAGSA